MAVMVRESDEKMRSITSKLNHTETQFATSVERDLLNEMEAGCSAPVGAYATIQNSGITLRAVALKTDGSLQYDIELTKPLSDAKDLGRHAARQLLKQGADKLLID
jgi:hydroxymethylbilane synthase